MTIDAVQNEIIDEFAVLGDDRESKVFYIMELGEKLPPLNENLKTDDNLIKGCQSKVWLTTSREGNRIVFHADSNTDIAKGLISLLIRVFSGRTPEEILQSSLFFLDKIGMGSLVGSQRSNGLAAMVKQIRMYALAYQNQS